MAAFLADLLTYTQLIATNWVSWIGGGLLAMDIAGRLTWKRGTKRRISWLTNLPFVWVAVACLLLATFQAWRDEKDTAHELALSVGIRRLTDAERSALMAALSPAGEALIVKIHSCGNRDPESYRYALDFVEVFTAAGWQVQENHSAFAIRLPGISLTTANADDPAAQRIATAIVGAGIALSDTRLDAGVPAGQLNVYVGAKPSGPLVR